MKNLRFAGLWVAVLIVIFIHTGVFSQAESSEWSVSSPGGLLTISTALTDGALTYTVRYRNDGGENQVIHPSRLGIVREDQSFLENLRFESVESPATIDESYDMNIGKQRQLRNHAHELTINLRNENDARLQVILRAYDDGVAFRYRFPETDSTPRTVIEEVTTFTVSEAGAFWGQPYDEASLWSPVYELLFADGAPIGTRASLLGKPGWAFPMLFHNDPYWILLTEADLDGHYFGAHLGPRPRDGTYEIAMPLPDEGQNNGQPEPVSVLPWATPWRVIMVGESPGTMVESSLVYHLSQPSQIADTSWIEPGRASWSWWSDHDSSKNFDSLMDYINLAADMGWEYSLVDANWNTMPEGSLEALVAHGQERGVGILLWYNSGGPHNIVTEQPRDLMFDRATRRAEFARLEALGVKGVKVDFFQSDKPEIIALYLDILQDAADYHLLVNFHGATLPRGWSRTWPNLMTMEAVRGAETYTYDSTYARTAAVQNTILPFTRNVVGPMDYTPVTFTDELVPHETTNAHELALSVIFESGIQHLADSAEAYMSLPEEPRAFLENVPTVWDETLYLAGEPGTFVVLARRNGEDWYIAGINGQDEGREVMLDVSFLDEQAYHMLLIGDGEDGRSFETTEGEITSGDSIHVLIMEQGGFAVRLIPVSS